MIHWAYNIGYIVLIALFCEVAYDEGVKVHKDQLEEALTMCKPSKHEEAYVAFAYSGLRCFKESTQWPHKAKGYTIVYNLEN